MVLTPKLYNRFFAGRGDSFWAAQEGRPGEMPCDTLDRLAAEGALGQVGTRPKKDDLALCFPSAAQESPATTDKKPIRVWHVDGSAECLDAMAQTLTRAGFEVTSRNSGAYAYGDIMTAGGIDADVAIIDYHVRPDGFEVAGHLITGLDLINFLADADNGCGPIIISTATIQKDSSDRSTVYLKKPIMPSELVQSVRSMGLIHRYKPSISEAIADAALEDLAVQRGKDPRHYKQ